LIGRERGKPRRPYLHRCNEPIAALGDGFNEAWLLSHIPQRLAELPHRVVQAVLKIDEGVFGPKFRPEFLAGDDFARLLEERQKEM
jgi:hypothetical protein